MTEIPFRRSRKAERRAETMKQVFDAAEKLVSRRGLHDVTFKDIAGQGGVHQTLLNCYFADKKALFDAAFSRLAAVSSARRMRALDAYEALAGDTPMVEGALHAFPDTDLDTYIAAGRGLAELCEAGGAGRQHVRMGAPMDASSDPVVLRLIALLKKAMAGCPEERIFWGHHFVTGGLMLTLARTGRIDKLSGGLCRSDDFIAVEEVIAMFMAAGCRSLCELRPRLRPTRASRRERSAPARRRPHRR